MPNCEVQTQLSKIIYGEGDVWNTFLAGIAELVGTALLILLGCGGCADSMASTELQKTFLFGLTVMIVVQCFGHISHAHVNPAITVGSVILGKKPIIEAMVFIIAQNLGAILGYGLLKMLIPSSSLGINFCVTNIKVSSLQGFMIETISTMILMTIACAVWDERNKQNTDSTALKFGLAVTCLATVFGPYTGCSMNPARSFGPALWNNNWSQQWIYWIAPIIGAALSSFFYRLIFINKINTINDKSLSHEVVALNSLSTYGIEKSEA